MPTRISSMRTALIAGVAGLIVMLISRLSLAVTLFLAAIGGALLMVVAGAAQITQLRRIMRRNRRKPPAS